MGMKRAIATKSFRKRGGKTTPKNLRGDIINKTLQNYKREHREMV